MRPARRAVSSIHCLTISSCGSATTERSSRSARRRLLPTAGCGRRLAWTASRSTAPAATVTVPTGLRARPRRHRQGNGGRRRTRAAVACGRRRRARQRRRRPRRIGDSPRERRWDGPGRRRPEAAVVPLRTARSRHRERAPALAARSARSRHHLVDPRTRSARSQRPQQVTVAAATCRAAEVAATAAFVAGPRLGSWLLERQGLAGLLVTDTGRRSRSAAGPGRTPPTRHDELGRDNLGDGAGRRARRLRSPDGDRRDRPHSRQPPGARSTGRDSSPTRSTATSRCSHSSSSRSTSSQSRSTRSRNSGSVSCSCRSPRTTGRSGWGSASSASICCSRSG